MVRFVFDFKGFLIGVLVVCFVLFLSYDSLRKWYEGDASPKDAMNKIQQSLGNTLKNTPKPFESEAPSSKESRAQQEKTPESVKGDETSPQSGEFSTEQAAHELLKKADE